MLSEKVREALNQQVNHEMQSFYIYLGMSAYFQAQNLTGFAHWMQVQAEEERGHAMRFYNYLFSRGGRAELRPLSAPPANWASPKAAFEEALHHEQKISALINDVLELAIAERDHATQAFLHWFVMEQIEEEATADEIIKRIELVGETPTGMYLLDRELAVRQGGSAEGEGGE